MAAADRFEYRLATEAIYGVPQYPPEANRFNTGSYTAGDSYVQDTIAARSPLYIRNDNTFFGKDMINERFIVSLSNRIWLRVGGISSAPGIIAQLCQAPNGDWVIYVASGVGSGRFYRWNGTSWDVGIEKPTGVGNVDGLILIDNTSIICTVNGRIWTHNGLSWDDGVLPSDIVGLTNTTPDRFNNLSVCPNGDWLTRYYRRRGGVWSREEVSIQFEGFTAPLRPYAAGILYRGDWIDVGKSKQAVVPVTATVPGWLHKIEVRGVNDAGNGPISEDWARTPLT